MSTKTISLRLEAYERLRAARRYSDESFSQVILRAEWPNQTISAADLLVRLREKGAHFSEAALDRLDRMKREAVPPSDKWADS